MFEGIGTYLSVLIALLLGYLIVKLYNFERSAPDLIQDALNDVGAQISKIFEKPVVKASMTNLGKRSGEVRASTALKNRVAKQVMGQNVLISKACEALGITPMEGLQLMQDPTIGPMIQGMMGKIQAGAGGLLGNLGGGGNGGPNAPGSSFKGYGREE